MDLIIIQAFVRYTDEPKLILFAESIFKHNEEIDRISFDFHGHLKTFERKNFE